MIKMPLSLWKEGSYIEFLATLIGIGSIFTHVDSYTFDNIST